MWLLCTLFCDGEMLDLKVSIEISEQMQEEGIDSEVYLEGDVL